MSVFQCEECGCAENTATGWYWVNKMVKDPKYYGRELCSICGPTHYDSGEVIEKMGKWHGRFPRKFYPHGSMRTDDKGNLVPKLDFENVKESDIPYPKKLKVRL